MRRLPWILLFSAGALAQNPIAVEETRQAARLVWLTEVARPVELRVDYGTAAWRDDYAQQLDKKVESTFRLGAGGWASLQNSAELQCGGHRLPPGLWYLALHRDAEARWSLAILDASKVSRLGLLPDGASDIKPSLLLPLNAQRGLPSCARLQVTLTAGQTPGTATVSLRWGEHELSTSFAVAIEPVANPAAPEFRRLDDARAKTTASGLRYEQLRSGVGKSPKPSDKVRVHYTGWLTDGTTIDSSIDRKQMLSFELDQVIKGWTEGLQLMAPGAVFLLEIPPELAYGAHGAGRIPANATLVFHIELFAIE